MFKSKVQKQPSTKGGIERKRNGCCTGGQGWLITRITLLPGIIQGHQQRLLTDNAASAELETFFPPTWTRLGKSKQVCFT